MKICGGKYGCGILKDESEFNTNHAMCKECKKDLNARIWQERKSVQEKTLEKEESLEEKGVRLWIVT